MKILVTGGLGFIGSHLVNALKDNHQITIIDNLYNSSIQTAAEFEKQGIKVFIEDVRRRKKASGEFDIIFHLSAHTSVARSVDNPLFDVSNNVLGTIAVIKNYPTKKFVYFSSGAVYGEGQNSRETDRPNPISPYGFSKLAGEVYTRMFCKDYLILRLANIYGDGSEAKSECAVIEHFKKDNPLLIYGEGEQTRDFLDVKDLIKIVIHLTNSLVCGTMNIGTGVPTRIIDLANKMANGRKIIHQNKRKGELIHNIMNVDELKKIIDFPLKKI